MWFYTQIWSTCHGSGKTESYGSDKSKSSPSAVGDEDVQSAEAAFHALIESIVTTKNLPEDVNRVYIDLWDFGGQLAFQVLQHLFFASRYCSYLLTFDCSHALNELMKDKLRLGDTVYSRQLVNCPTRLEALLSWLQIIHLQQLKSGEVSHNPAEKLETENQEVGKSAASKRPRLGPDGPPLVHLVGCKADKLGSSSDSKEKSIQVALQHGIRKPYHKYIHQPAGELKVTFVDNRKPSDPKFTILQQEITNCILSRPAIQNGVPLSWILLGMALKHFAELGHVAVTLELASRVAKVITKGALSDEEEIVDALKYHHAMGQLLFFSHSAQPSLQRRVVVGIESLIQCVSTLCEEASIRPEHVIDHGVAADDSDEDDDDWYDCEDDVEDNDSGDNDDNNDDDNDDDDDDDDDDDGDDDDDDDDKNNVGWSDGEVYGNVASGGHCRCGDKFARGKQEVATNADGRLKCPVHCLKFVLSDKLLTPAYNLISLKVCR